jgi:phenylacetate-CoA ligase
MTLNKLVFKYVIYYPVVLIRGEWIWSYLSQLKRSQYFSRKKLEEIQFSKLRRLIDHANATVPWYQGRLPVIENLADLKKIPLIEKQTIRDQADAFASRKKYPFLRRKTSGGSTGAPVTIYKDSAAMGAELAGSWRGYSWAGIDIGDRQVRFWGVPMTKGNAVEARLIDFVANRCRVSAFAFEQRDLESSYRKIRRFNPVYFYGYVSMIVEFANFVMANNLRGELTPKAIITTSEVLTAIDRKIIADAFRCPVFNEYGCGEVGVIAQECEAGSLHVLSENVIVEVVNDRGEPVLDGQPGALVVTDLTNYAMPLLRYRIMDYGTLTSDSCACGRGLPVLGEIYGREYDILRNSAGKSFHGEFFLYLAEDAKRAGMAVSGYQVIQKAENRLEIRMVCSDADYPRLCQYLEKQLKMNFDEGVVVDFQKVDGIPREPSGKLRVIKKDFCTN